MNNTLFRIRIIFFLLACILLLTTIKATTLEEILSRPDINGSITNDGPVTVGEAITFFGQCIGSDARLVLCKDNVICNSEAKQEDVLCASDFSNDTSKTCVYSPTDLDEGTHDTDIATCCNVNNQCDVTTKKIDDWVVQAALSSHISLKVVDELNEEIPAVVNVKGSTTTFSFSESFISALAFTDLKGGQFMMSNFSRGLIEPDQLKFLKVYSFDFTTISFTKALLSSTALSPLLYICRYWDIGLSTCLGGWEFFQSLPLGASYDVHLPQGAFAFAEGYNVTLGNVAYVPAPEGVHIQSHITSNGPVVQGESLTFTAQCQGKNTQLVVCRDNVACDAHTPSSDLLCMSGFDDASFKTCTYTTAALDAGTNVRSVATCCTPSLCASTTQLVDPWVVAENLGQHVTPLASAADEDNIESEELVQGAAEIYKPVKWTKKIHLNETVATLTVQLPTDISGVHVEKITNATTETVSDDKLTLVVPQETSGGGNAITGFAIQERSAVQENNTLLIEDPVKDVNVEYYTEAPQTAEEGDNPYQKRITVYSNVHYEHIFTYTTIPDSPEDGIAFFRIVNDSKIPMTNYTYIDTNLNGLIDRLEWITPSLSNDTYEVDITILNVQSHPSVGGNWTVYFTTGGKANLTITAVNGTQWSDVNDSYDLQFIEVHCGDQVKPYVWNNNSVFIQEYECNDTSSEFSYVLTSGKHYLEFQFGDAVGYADNYASTLTISGTTTLCGEVTIYDQIVVTGTGRLLICASNGTWGSGWVNISLNKYDNLGNFTVMSGGVVLGNGSGGPGGGTTNSFSVCSTQGGNGQNGSNGTASCKPLLGGGSGALRAGSGDSGGGSGGSFGGVGGLGGISANGTQSAVSFTYGSNTGLTLFAGSGGGGEEGDTTAGTGPGGHGGGGIEVNASEGVINIQGVINMTGMNGAVGDLTDDSGSGGGSGGHVILIAKTMNLSSGIIIADGGNGGNVAGVGTSSDSCGGGGGGGGRILYVYQTIFTNGFNNTIAGGARGNATELVCDQVADVLTSTNGSAGTILLNQTTFSTAPLVTIRVPANTTYTALPLNFNVTLNENGSQVLYSLNNLNNVSMSTPDNVTFNASNTSIANGAYLFAVYANDTAGNINSTESVWFSVNVATNTAPTIGNLSVIPDQSITENSRTNVEFTFVVTDVDGNSNLNDTSLRATFNKTGETTRFNNTCRRLTNLSTAQANFSCTVDLWYYDNSGVWDVNVTIKDLNNAWGENTTTNLTLGSSTSIVMSPTALTWPSFGINDVNQTSNNDPIVINNTGNKNITLNGVTVNGTDLVGETTNTQSILVINFSVSDRNGSTSPNFFECNRTILVNDTIVNITGTNITRGNTSVDDNTGQQKLYFCITSVLPTLSAQPYSTAQLRAWTIAVS